MRSRTLANEKTRCFYTQLKRPYLFSWYLPSLGDRNTEWRSLSGSQKRNRFEIDQIAFFKKHFWYHFCQPSVNGWIPIKHFRKNYCQLKVRGYKCSKRVNSELACVIMLCRYVNPDVNIKDLIKQYLVEQPLRVGDFFGIVAERLGTFKNLSRKSMRRIRNQIRHQRPVVMRVWFESRAQDLIVIGFNRRLFMCRLPLTGRCRMISRKPLLKAWQRCNYQAFSC